MSIGLLVSLCVFMAIFFTYMDYKGYYKTSVVLKSCTTLLIILLSVNCFIYKNLDFKIYFYFIFVGLCFGLLGDFLLGLKKVYVDKQYLFLGGLVAFLLGHLFYIMAMNTVVAIGITDFTFTIIYLSIAYFVLKKSDLDLGKFKYGVILYACVISFMLSKATSIFIFSPNSVFGCVVFVGALLFVLSDALLSFSLFGHSKKNIFSLYCHLLYFPAQIILALSILVISLK